MNSLMKRLLAAFSMVPLCSAVGLPSVAIYYGYNPPVHELAAYDAVVVQPTANIDPKKYNTSESQLFAYVSVGELEPTASYHDKVPASWIIGQNTTWKSKVIDQSQPEWPSFFVDQVITPLWAKGYHGFFFDTMDSYQLAVTSPAARKKQEDGLITLIRSVKKRYPDAQIILNRGFPMLPSVNKLVYAVAAESLFSSWNENLKQYQPVTTENREGLLVELRKAQALGLPVVVIDYVDPSNTEAAAQVAHQITELGMIPWVTDGHLQTMGRGEITAFARKILVIYSGDKVNLASSVAFNSLAMPLEYLGYTPEFHEVNEPLPLNINASNGYAGIIFWAATPSAELQTRLHSWFLDAIKSQTPLVLMEQVGFNLTPETGAPFGLVPNTLPGEEGSSTLHISHKDPSLIGFESEAFLNKHEFTPLRAKDSTVLLQVMNQQKEVQDAIAITPWGGYALAPYVQVGLPGESNLWVLDPIKWLPLALHQKPFPIPDVTTENGQRLMMVHISGEGFATPSDWPFGSLSAEVIKKEILEKYQIPTLVSINANDFSAATSNEKQSKDLITHAQALYKLPWVEMGSHSDIKKNPDVLAGVNFINSQLAPAGKVCKVLTWSEEAIPTTSVLKFTQDQGLLNINGGATDITHNKAFLTRIHPMAVKRGPYLQIYSPIASEANYTNGWSEPFYGYRRVLETLQLTDGPRRFKPIDLHYHFYSASKHAGITALIDVYQWAAKQSVIHFFESEYIAKVRDFYKMRMALKKDGGFEIVTGGSLRELRVPISQGYPDLSRSVNLVGFNRIHDNYYLHLGPHVRSLIYFTPQLPTQPYLHSANGTVTRFERNTKSIHFGLNAHVPLQLTLGNMQACQLHLGKTEIKPSEMSKDIARYQLTTKVSDELYIHCG